MRKIIACVAVASALGANVVASNADELQGEVHAQTNMRINRPLSGTTAAPLAGHVSEMGSGKPLNGALTDDSFNLSGNLSGTSQPGAALTGQAAQNGALSGQVEENKATGSPLSGLLDENKLSGGATASLIPGQVAAPPMRPLIPETPRAESPKVEPNYHYGEKKPLKASVTFRFTYYDLGDGWECTWEGLRDANYLLGRGADVVIMLDRGGVRLANKHNGQEYQLHRGSTERLVKTQNLLRGFIDKGGTVVASERWTRHFGLWGGSYPSLTEGVKLLGDEDMADMLVERDGRLVDY